MSYNHSALFVMYGMTRLICRLNLINLGQYLRLNEQVYTGNWSKK